MKSIAFYCQMYGKNPRLRAKNSTSHKINEGWKIGFWRTFNWSWLITLCYCQTWKLQIHTYILINTLSDTKGSWLKLCKWLLLFFERTMNRRWDGGRNKKNIGIYCDFSQLIFQNTLQRQQQEENFYNFYSCCCHHKISLFLHPLSTGFPTKRRFQWNAFHVQ